jgi:hypothetical protein
MTTYDPAWDMPTLNWKQQGSFEAGAVPPITEPDAGTQIFLGPFAQEWMPYICGALDQLRNPSAWVVADDDAMYNTLRRVDTLLGLICGVRADCVPTETRFLNCVLETSTDGGTTWTPVPGWISDFGNCVRDNIPPPPPNPGPDPTQQRACNISGYIATVIVSDAIVKAVTDYGTTKVYVDYAKWAVSNALAEEMPYLNLFVQAVFQIYQDLTALNIAEFTAASTDPVLIGLLTCAIYQAIKTDGHFTDANFPAALANVCGVTYASPDVITAICAMMTTIGSVNMRALQVTGAYEVYDCTGCGSWCNQELFQDTAGAYSVYATYGGWVIHQGWETTAVDGTRMALQIHAGPSSVRTATGLQIQVQSSINTLNVGGRQLALRSGGVVVGVVALPDIAYPTPTVLTATFAPTACDEYIINWANDGTVPAIVFGQQDSGNAPAPGLAEPCTF